MSPATAPPKRACATCEFWCPNEGRRAGECRANAPSTVGHLWPITHDDHWCGAHKADWGRARTWSLPESVA